VLGNALIDCTSPTSTAQTITFTYAPGAKSFGIGLANFQSGNSPSYPITNHELFVNGVDLGVLETLAGNNWSPGITLNAYLRIDAANGSVITSVAFESLNGIDVEGFSDLAVEPPSVTSTALAASSTSTTTGIPITFTAKVTEDPGSGVPTGTTTFKRGSTVLATATLGSSGVATFATSALPAGSDSITAAYGGDHYNLASTSAAVIVTVKIAVPNVVGLTQAAATAAITKAVLTVGTVTKVPSTTAASVSVADSAAGSPQSVALSGTGAAAGSSTFVFFSPSALEFSSRAAGTTSPAQTVELTNSGGATLSITSTA
jgi:hypothetical protein